MEARRLPAGSLALASVAAVATTRVEARGRRVVADLPYRSEAGPTRRLDLHRPKGPAPARGWPVVLAIHGGGWRQFDKAQYAPKLAGLLQRGFAVVAPDYTLSRPGRPSWPTNLADLRGALDWVAAEGPTWGLDSGRVAAVGESAGGHLALMLAAAPDEAVPALRAVASFSGPTDLVPLARPGAPASSQVRGLVGGTARDALEEASPARQVRAGLPPMLLVHGAADDLVPTSQARRLARALARAGDPRRLVIVPGAGHELDPRGDRSLLALLVRFPAPVAGPGPPLVRRRRPTDNHASPGRNASAAAPRRIGEEPGRSGMTDPRPSASITSQAGVDSLVEHLRAAGRFAFDTEFISEGTFEPELGLVQVATTERLALVDPLAGLDLAPFWDAVTDPALEVVMHAPGEDLWICRLQSGRLPERVVDVQVAAGLVGFGYPSALGSLAAQVLRVTLHGGETRTDWMRRPLTPGQQRYALDDVRYLLDLADRLGGQLEALGRSDWAEVEYRARIEAVAARDDGLRWRRLPGLGGLNRRGLEVARRAWDWRRDQARRTNRPARQVLRDDLLVALARRQPASVADLETIRDFQRPHLVGQARALVQLVADAQAVPDDDLPEPPERHEEGPGQGMLVNVLAAVLHRCCAEHRVAPGLVGSQADLKELIRWVVAGRPEADRPDLVAGWREGVCGRVLIDVLEGRRSLRVVDPNSDVPVASTPPPETRRDDPRDRLLHQRLRRLRRLARRRGDPLRRPRPPRARHEGPRPRRPGHPRVGRGHGEG